MSKKISKEKKVEFLKLFVEFFLKNPKKTYMEFCLEIKQDNQSLEEIINFNDAIRKDLQRCGALICRKVNDAQGFFYSEKKLDLQKINDKFGTSF